MGRANASAPGVGLQLALALIGPNRDRRGKSGSWEFSSVATRTFARRFTGAAVQQQAKVQAKCLQEIDRCMPSNVGAVALAKKMARRIAVLTVLTHGAESQQIADQRLTKGNGIEELRSTYERMERQRFC